MPKTIKQKAQEFIAKTGNELIDCLSYNFQSIKMSGNNFTEEHNYIMKYFCEEGIIKIITCQDDKKNVYAFTKLGKKALELNERRKEYCVDCKVNLPKNTRDAKKGKPGKYSDRDRHRLTKYPYDLLEYPGWSFHVPETYENMKPEQRLGPSVARINNHYRDKDGKLTRRFVWRKVDETDPCGRGARVWRVQ